MNKKPSQLTEGQSIRFTFSYSKIVATFTVDYGVLRLRFQIFSHQDGWDGEEAIETAFPGGVLSPEVADAIFSAYEGETHGRPATKHEKESSPTAIVIYSL